MEAKKLFLLDAYALIYRAYYAFIRAPRINSKGLNTSAIYGFVNTLEDVIKSEKPSHIGVVFDPKGPTFRHEQYPPYKAQREATPEDIRKAIPIIKSILEAYNIPVIEVSGYEADDVIGTLSCQAEDKGFTTFMMTPDKDYGQLVTSKVYMYRPARSGKKAEVLGVAEICEKFSISEPKQVIDILGLMGDSSDNIPGCPGVGEKTAAKLISTYGSIENLLDQVDQLKGKQRERVSENKEQILLSKDLATIRIDVAIELDEEALKLTQPKKKQLGEIFRDLEFRAFADRILGVTNQPVQGTLFGTEEPLLEEEEPAFRSLKDVEHRYVLVDTPLKRASLAAELSVCKEFCFDTETTSVVAMKAELVGLSFSYNSNQAFYVPIPSDYEEACKIVEEFRLVFEDPQIGKIGQNIKYDILLLKNYNITVEGLLWDTMIAHYLIQPELRHNMDYMAEQYLKYRTIHIEELIGKKGKNQKSMRDIPVDKVYEYACEDADITFQLKGILEKELKEHHLESLFYDLEMPLVGVLSDMEWTGVKLDVEALNSYAKVLGEQIQRLEEEIIEMAGMAFNVASPKQVGEVLFGHLKIDEKAKKTKTGQYSTGEEVLAKLQGKHPIVEKILEFRGLKKLLNTYVEALPELVNEKTGKIHTSFNQAVAATGRLSSNNPNLQNIPIRDEAGREIRKAFIPEEQCLFFSADYSQVELRIMAHLSQDPHMIAAFNGGEDIHAATAAKVFNVPIEWVTPEMRRKAKTANFGIIYGISAFGLAERLNIPRKEAKGLIDGYFETYPDIKKYMDEAIAHARDKEYVETLLGRKRYLPDINSRNGVVRGVAERNAINAPIQGTAADIIKKAMIAIFRRFKDEGLKSRLILQVHDELNFNVYPGEMEKVKTIVIEEMEQAFPIAVPLTVDWGEGVNWLEAH